MKPILFDKTATQFNTNGIGRLDCVECLVIEERNGQYELEMTISQESQYASDIGMESIIVVKPNDSDPLQAFRVYQITKPIGGLFEVFANHIRYQLNYIPTMPFSVSASTSACAQTLAGLKNNAVSNCPFIFHTDVQTVASYQQNLPASIGTMMGGTAGSVIDQFGGEWKYDNYDVYLYHHRGVQNPTVTFRYGKDITDLKQEEEIANTITGIVPFWTDSEGGELVTLPEKVVESPNASNFTFKRIVTIDFSGDFENKPTQNALRTHAQAYINKAGIGIPNVSIDVSFIDLAKTMEYEDLLQFQSVNLCDIVGISFVNLGIDTTAKIVKVVYNVLKERYESIEIGAVRSSVAHTLNNTNASVMALADTTKTNFAKAANETDGKIADALDDISDTYSTKQEVQTAIDNATSWLTQTGGVIRALKNSAGEWTDLLCMSATATATTGNVLRFNVNGIGFSSTGWNGTYTQAWTLDGRLVIGGTNVPSLTVYDNNNNVIFQTDATKIIWNATNSSMSANGTLTANNGTFTDCIIRSNDPNKPNYIKLNQGTILFGTNNVDGANITGEKTKVLIDASDSGHIFGSDVTFGAQTDGDIYIASHDGSVDIRSTNYNEDVSLTSENGSVRIVSKNVIELNSDTAVQVYPPLYVASTIEGNDPQSLIIGNDPFIKFFDSIDNMDDNITLDGDVIAFSADEIVVRNGRGYGQYSKGYTGTFSVEKAGGGTTTLNFVNGLLV